MLLKVICIAAIVAGTFLLRAEFAYACSCIPPTPKEALAEAGTVFVGRVQRVQEHTVRGYRPFYLFDVERMWKGKPTSTISIGTTGSDSCGFDFEIGQKYLVFASWWSEEGIWTTGQCTGTQEVERGDAILATLGPGWLPSLPWLPLDVLPPLLTGVAFLVVVAIYVFQKHRRNHARPVETA